MTRMWREPRVAGETATTAGPATLRLMSLMAAATVIWLIVVSSKDRQCERRSTRRQVPA